MECSAQHQHDLFYWARFSYESLLCVCYVLLHLHLGCGSVLGKLQSHQAFREFMFVLWLFQEFVMSVPITKHEQMQSWDLNMLIMKTTITYIEVWSHACIIIANHVKNYEIKWCLSSENTVHSINKKPSMLLILFSIPIEFFSTLL